MGAIMVLVLIFGPGVLAGLFTGIGDRGASGLAYALGGTFLYGMAIWLLLFVQSAVLAEVFRGTLQVAAVAVVNVLPFWGLGRLLRTRTAR